MSLIMILSWWWVLFIDLAGLGDEHVWLDLRGLDESAHDQEESQANRSWWEERPALRRVCQRLRDVRDELCRVWGLPQGPAQVQLACYPGHNARYERKHSRMEEISDQIAWHHPAQVRAAPGRAADGQRS